MLSALMSDREQMDNAPKKRPNEANCEWPLMVANQRVNIDTSEFTYGKRSQFRESRSGRSERRAAATGTSDSFGTVRVSGSQCGKAKKRANEANFTWPLNVLVQ